MTCGMHEYYLVLHVLIQITSKNDDVCKLCATERIFRLTWPQLWRQRSNVREVGVLKFSGGRKKDGRKAIEKMVTIERLTKKMFQKNRRGGGLHQPVPARVKYKDNPKLLGDAVMGGLQNCYLGIYNFLFFYFFIFLIFIFLFFL